MILKRGTAKVHLATLAPQGIDMASKRLYGIIPPLPTPMTLARDAADIDAFAELVDLHLKSGVHGLWILGTTSKFDLVTDRDQRAIAETAARLAAGRVPLVLNISDQGTQRTLEKARTFDDLPYDYYAALPPWYQPMSPAEVIDYFHALANGLSKPLVIYNAPWINNQLSFENLCKLSKHPRIVGTKDVTPSLGRAMYWKTGEHADPNFSYLHGSDLLALSTEMGADGFVSALSDLVPALAVATFEAARNGDSARAYALQNQFVHLARATEFGSFLGCLDAAGRHLGLFQTMLPQPLRAVDADTERRVIAVFDQLLVFGRVMAMRGGMPEAQPSRS